MNKDANICRNEESSSLIQYLLGKGGELVSVQESREDFKRHMDNVGPVAEYYKQKEREGLAKARQRAVGKH